MNSLYLLYTLILVFSVTNKLAALPDEGKWDTNFTMVKIYKIIIFILYIFVLE